MTDEFSSKNVGDETDTSPFADQTNQQYISTPAFIRNMTVLIRYIQSGKKSDNNVK
jgi:hypothetical protein